MKKKRVLDLSSVVGDFQNDDVLHYNNMEPMMEAPSEEQRTLLRRTSSKRHSKSTLSTSVFQENYDAAVVTATESADESIPQCVSDDEQVEITFPPLEAASAVSKRRLEGQRGKKRKVDSSLFFEPISCNKELVDPEFDVWFASSFHILVLSHMVACTQVEEPCARCRLCSPGSAAASTTTTTCASFSANTATTAAASAAFVCPTVESLQTQLPNMADHLMQYCPDCPPWLRHKLQVQARQQQQQQQQQESQESYRLRDEYAQCVWGRLQGYATSRRTNDQGAA